MTKEEIAEWLGFPPGVEIHEDVITGMADVKAPVTDEEHIAAFRKFLEIAPKATLLVIVPKEWKPLLTETHLHNGSCTPERCWDGIVRGPFRGTASFHYPGEQEEIRTQWDEPLPD